MNIAEIVSLLLQLGLYLAESLGHTNDELKAEFAKQLGHESASKKTWEEWLEEKKSLPK